MKVAIMGAGLSGLCCAIILEKHGIYPDIFEKRNQVGDRFVNGEVMLSILNKPVCDSLTYLSEKYGIYVSPISNLNNMTLYSEHERAVITGNIGFSNIRGRHENSLEKQLERQVRSRIYFNSDYDYHQLLNEYTHVILSTGDGAYASGIQHFQQDLTVTIKGAIVEGSFEPSCVAAWLDNNIAPNGYGYLIPFSDKLANISIAYPDYPENRPTNLDNLWDIFYKRVCSDLNQSLRTTDRFEITRYIIGRCKCPRIGNTFFTGNCLCSVMPLFGFGQFASMQTGIYGALDLCGEGNYIELTKPIVNSYDNSLVLRRALEQLDNHGLDSIVKVLRSSIGDRLFNTRSLDPLKLMSYLIRPLIWNKSRKV